jgi:hypothetical protein
MSTELEIAETLLRRGWKPPLGGSDTDVATDAIKTLLNPEFCGCAQQLNTEEIGQRFCRWPEDTITWTIRDVLPSLGAQMMRAACEAALADIAGHFELSFPYVEDASQANILITVAPLGGRGGVLADCQLVPCNIGPKNSVQMLMRADRSENWISENTPAGLNIDWQRVFAHEFIHGLGLPHITTPGSLMLPTYSTSIRTIQPGDIEALEQLGYKRRKAPPLPTPTQPSPGEPELGRVDYRRLSPGVAYTPKKRAWVLEEL